MGFEQENTTLTTSWSIENSEPSIEKEVKKEAESLSGKESLKITNTQKEETTLPNATSTTVARQDVVIDSGSNLIQKYYGKELTPNPQDSIYIQNYIKTQLELDPQTHSFVVTPRLFFNIENILPDFTTKISSILNLDKERRAWEASPILSILAKSLLEESTKYSTWIAQKIAENTEVNSTPLICDLCSGAGITSSKVYIELKNKGIQNVQIHAIDNSIESLSVSLLLFETQGIPCKLVKDIKDLKSVPKEYDGVILVFADAETYMGDVDEDIAYNHIMSENGISYFSREKHDRVLLDSKPHLKPNARIYLASLNPNLTVQLSKPFLIKEILTGKGKAKKYSENIAHGKNQYEISNDGRIRKAMTIETGRQIEFMRLLLTQNPLEFFRYMKGLTKATKAALVLREEILSPVNEIKADISKIFNGQNSHLDTYPNINGSPCDAIEIKV